MESSLDALVDNALDQNPSAADWHDAAKHFAPSRAAEQSDAYARLFGTEFGRRAHSIVKNETLTLGEIGNFAGHVLGEVVGRARFGIAHPFPAGGEGPPPVLVPSEPWRRPNFERARRIIVFHGKDGNQRSLLILDPTLPSRMPPAVLPASTIRSMLEDADLPSQFHGKGIGAESWSDVMDAFWIARPNVILAPEPQLIYTCVVRPPAAVSCKQETSMCGAYAYDHAGASGVTVCYHGTGPKGTSVTINGVARSVSQDSIVVDTCFVPVPKQELPPTTKLVGRGGVLSKRAPGANERHTFWAAGGGVQDARIVGVDYGVAVVTPNRQLCVYTEAVTNYGDSGGALVNDYDELVGFCFQRTPFGSSNGFSTWIWAAAAFNELSLRPY